MVRNLRKKPIIISILVLITIVVAILLYNSQMKPITAYLHASSQPVVKISVFFEGSDKKFYEIVDSKDINDFMGYLNTCILKEKLIQNVKAGYTSHITIFYSDGSRDDLAISDTISISQKEYSLVKGDLSKVNIQKLLQPLN